MIKTQHNTKIAFGDNYHQQWKNGVTLYNESSFFRNDMDWGELANTINDEFKHQDKVPIICGACSDGSEPYTVSISLQEKLQEKSQKFLPIDAFDYGDEIIKKAKSNQLQIDPSSKLKSIPLDKYFKKQKKSFFSFKENNTFNAQPNLSKTVKFSVGNVFDKAKQTFEKPCVFMFRNAWYQIAKEDNSGVKELATSLFQNLKKGSLVVLGHYDLMQKNRIEFINLHKVPETLKEVGFEALHKATCKYPISESIPLIFKKVK